MKLYLLGAALFGSSCTLLLGAQKPPSCDDGIRDPGELCFQAQRLTLLGGSEYSVIADFDGDDLPDVAVGNSLGLVELFFQDEDGAFAAGPSANAGEFINGIIAADFNQDGRVDLATANRNNFSVFLNQGDRSFDVSTNPGCLNGLGVAACDSVNWVEATDLDADGDLDLVVIDEKFDDPDTGPDEGAALWINDGEGDFSFQESLDFGSNEQAAYGADLDQDGRVELLVVVGGGDDLAITERDDAGNFDEPGQLFQVGVTPKTAAITDFNQDAAQDVVVANNDGTLTLFVNPNDGTLDLIQTDTFFIGGGPRTVVSADLEGDGDLDLVVSNDDDSIGLSFIANDGAGNFSPLFTQNSFDRIFGVTVGDLNLDGLPDFVLSANDFGDDDEASLVLLLSAP